MEGAPTRTDMSDEHAEGEHRWDGVVRGESLHYSAHGPSPVSRSGSSVVSELTVSPGDSVANSA